MLKFPTFNFQFPIFRDGASQKFILKLVLQKLVYVICNMGNTKKIFKPKAAEKFAGIGGIAQYFKPKKKRGRPSKKSKQNKTIATNDMATKSTKSPPTIATTINTSSTTTTTAAGIEISIEINNNNNNDVSEEDNNNTASKKEQPKVQHKKTRRNWAVGEDRSTPPPLFSSFTKNVPSPMVK